MGLCLCIQHYHQRVILKLCNQLTASPDYIFFSYHKNHGNFILVQEVPKKIVPVHKKGSKTEIENYRPVANLCSASNIFERLILNRIAKLEILNKIDITGNGQHGFKKGRGTVTAGLLLQSLISRSLDDDEYVAMASLDLSAAFDVVNSL